MKTIDSQVATSTGKIPFDKDKLIFSFSGKTLNSTFKSYDREKLSDALRIIHTVIKRIELPKYGEPFQLSYTDKVDAEMAGLLACIECGFFENGYSVDVWKAIRNAINGRDCLRLRCNRENYSANIETIAESVGFSTEYKDEQKKLTSSQLAMSKELMRVLRAGFEADKSKKRKSNFQIQRNFFLMFLSQITEKQPRNLSKGAFATSKSRFIDYLARGAKHLEKNLQARPVLAAEIMQAMATRKFS